MTNPTQQWQQIHDEYLTKVQNVLAGAPQNEKQQILDDIKVHLKERYNELSEDEKTWESFQKIIIDLGPVEDYADLLEEKSMLSKQSPKKSSLVWSIIGGLLLFGVFYLIISIPIITHPAGYIISFSPDSGFAPTTPPELLAEFNRHHPANVSTSYFRTEPANGKLIGSIFTSTRTEKQLLVEMLKDTPTLTLLKAKRVYGNELAAHKAKKQLSLPSRPRVVRTYPNTLSFDVDPKTTEISVTFDQPMMNLSWSWVGGDFYPETTGNPKYDKERKTCALPVKLKAGNFYWIGINSEKFVYFQTEKHVPAMPYVILFATADENGNPTEIPTEYIEEAKRINSK